MSADLLAAFGSPEAHESRLELTNTSAIHHPTSNANQSTGSPWILQSRPLPQKTTKTPEQPLWKQDSKGAEVLFDASDDDQEEDDFGDFEDPLADTEHVGVAPVQQLQSTEADLLGLDDFSDMQIRRPEQPSTTNIPNTTSEDDLFDLKPEAHGDTAGYHPHNNPRNAVLGQSFVPFSTNEVHIQDANNASPEDDDWGDFEDTAVSPIEGEELSKATLSASSRHETKDIFTNDNNDIDDNWGTFEEESPPATPSLQPLPAKRSPNTTNPITTTVSPIPTATKPESQPLTHPRPTNIPPPSTLLQLLPQIYQLLTQQSHLSNPTQAPSPSLATLAQKVYTTTAHLISGRTHRWKRDTHLSQSIRISQAGIKNTGMKLTTLDKSMTVKEDQDVMEAIAAWQHHAPTLNAVMLKGKVAKPPGILGATMPVRMTSGLGVLASKECCALCGLKRNERVGGIDVKVEDVFGEWWVEFWGHRDCYDFWYRYEGLLSRR